MNRETYDYADFLRRYMSLGEVTQVNQDEFDYIYYTYGLSLYGNMPLKGMINFTDGRGIFPEKKPDYDAAFVFLDDGYAPPDVPVWAIKLVLQSEEI